MNLGRETAPAVLLAFLLVAAAPARGDEADDFMRAEMSKRRIPGAALLVARGGRVVKLKAYGLANAELNVPAGEETLFQLASLTKTFTAVAVMSLAEEGRLSLDAKARSLLPSLPRAWGGVTVRQLLSHTSGLPDVSLGDDTDEVIAATLPEALRKLARMRPAARPGARWAYNQTGYVLLGIIVEKVSGVGFEEFMARRFFRPLGMTRTVFGDDGRVVIGRASMYTRYERQSDKEPSPAGLWTHRNLFPAYLHPAGGLNTSAADLAKWDAALSGGRLLKPASLAEMWLTARLSGGRAARLGGTLGYGLGWMVDERAGHRAAGHSGGDAVSYIRFLDDGLSVAVLTNCQGADPDSLAFGVASLYVPALGRD
ncbi:MAG TPA: serine hydrolase domain-containing protein [Pyrinomonadaceae bacterium]|jgi:CubicO group peptidase (beta-lactamase class C family)